MPFNSLSRSLVLQKSPDLEDLVNFTLECCHSGGTFDEIESTNKLAIPQKQQQLQPEATDANKGRWKSNRRGGYGVTSSLRKSSTSLRKSSTSLISSFTKMAGGRADAGTDAAALVSAEFYEEEEKMEKDKVSERTEIKASNSMKKIFSTMNLSLSNSNKSKSKAGNCPSGATTRSCTPSLDEDIALQVGTSVTEYLEECLSAEVTVLDREKFKSVPEYIKSDFAMTGFIGRGSYSDVFEVSITVPIYENEGVGGDVSSMKKKLKTGNMLSRIESSADLEDLKGQEEEDIDKLIEGLGNLGKLTSSAVNPIISTVVPRNYEPAKSALATSDIGSLYPARRRASTNRRGSLSGSANFYTVKKTTRSDERRVIYAMKCLRPTARSDFEHFTIGAEDLVHETAMLASLDHPNIVKLHGRAAGNLSNAFKLNDGYFVLLDRLKDTLDDRIVGWKKSSSGCADQIEVAHSITNAMSYLVSLFLFVC